MKRTFAGICLTLLAALGHAHEYEAWICAFYYHQPSIIYTGERGLPVCRWQTTG